MEPPPRPSSSAPSRRTSPQSSQSEPDQDTSHRSSATELQQTRQAPSLGFLPPTQPTAEELLEERSLGELNTSGTNFSSLHDITIFAMSRHQSAYRSQPDHNPSIQLLSPESAKNPRRMSQVSPGFIFVIFPMFPNCIFLPLLSLSLLFPKSDLLCLSFVIRPATPFVLC